VPERAGAADWSRLLGGPRNAKEQFEALQSANDSGDLQRLRECLTPAMFELAQERWRARGGAVQHTQVFGLEAQVVDVAGAAGDHVVSVRFTGRVRGQVGDVPQDLDETWHMTKPRKGRGGWVLAGIQQAPQFP
jgi:predicted lipid-binding transport protein (Tim44 family)